jgi:hypothetical protein
MQESVCWRISSHSASGFCQIPSLWLRLCPHPRTVLADESIGCEILDVWHVGCTIRTVTNEAGAQESLKVDGKRRSVGSHSVAKHRFMIHVLWDMLRSDSESAAVKDCRHTLHGGSVQLSRLKNTTFLGGRTLSQLWLVPDEPNAGPRCWKRHGLEQRPVDCGCPGRTPHLRAVTF